MRCIRRVAVAASYGPQNGCASTRDGRRLFRNVLTQHEPQPPWFLTAETTPFVRQSISVGSASTATSLAWCFWKVARSSAERPSTWSRLAVDGLARPARMHYTERQGAWETMGRHCQRRTEKEKDAGKKEKNEGRIEKGNGERILKEERRSRAQHLFTFGHRLELG